MPTGPALTWPCTEWQPPTRSDRATLQRLTVLQGEGCWGPGSEVPSHEGFQMKSLAGTRKHWVTRREPLPTEAGTPQLLASVELGTPSMSLLSTESRTNSPAELPTPAPVTEWAGGQVGHGTRPLTQEPSGWCYPWG